MIKKVWGYKEESDFWIKKNSFHQSSLSMENAKWEEYTCKLGT